MKVMANDGEVLGMKRVDISRTTTKATVVSAKKYQTENSDVPGRIIIMTPTKPTSAADQRRHPTGSRRMMAAAAVMARGTACRTPETSAIGKRKSAVRNVNTAPTSATFRISTGSV